MSYAHQGEDGDEDTQDFAFQTSLTGTIFVVDCSPDMICTVDGSEAKVTGVILALEAIKSTYQQRLISGTSDYLGVVMVGVKDAGDRAGIKTLLPLDTPDKNSLRVVEDLLKRCRGGTGIVGNEEYSPYERLWVCNSMYTSCVKKLGSRQVIIFTNVSEPPMIRSDPKIRTMATTKSRDMSEIGVLISLITTPGTSAFNMDLFYSSIVPDTHRTVNPTEDIEDFCDRVKQQQTRVRTSASIPFFLGPKEIGVACSALYGTTKTTGVNLCSVTNQQVSITSALVRESDRAVLLPHEVYRSAQLGSGGPPILLSQEDVDEMAPKVDKGIHVLSMEPADTLKAHHLGGKTLFIRPSDKVYQGSTKFFCALLERMLARDLIARCHCVPRTGFCGYLGALVPQKEETNADGKQVRAAGFNLIRLPYKNSIKKIDYEGLNMPSQTQISAAKSLALKLRAKWSPELMENPTTSQFNKALEAIALEKDRVETPEDQTQPDVTAMRTRAGSEMDAFNKSVFPAGYQLPEACKKVDYKPIIRKVRFLLVCRDGVGSTQRDFAHHA